MGRGARGITRRHLIWAAVAAVTLLAGAGSAWASHLFSDTAGHTTLEQVVTGSDPDAGYSNLHTEGTSGTYVVRDAASESNPVLPNALPGRETRRESLAYFSQMTDFQLADEESPARVEFLDGEPSGVGAAAWRPQEALHPFIVDWSIRQINQFVPASPVPQGDGSRARMAFTVLTGDQMDSTQRNEGTWVRELLEGGRTQNFNSGSTNPADYDPVAHPSCAAYPPTPDHLAEAGRYTGVQDYTDYTGAPQTYFYDPNDVRAYYAANGWPSYPGLLDRAEQMQWQPAGLDVPSYVANGNHDGLVQGNEDANAAFEEIATGCFKATGSTQSPLTNLPPPDGLDPNPLLSPSTGMLVPPDPARRYVDKRQVKAIYKANGADNGHGYDFVDPAEDAASNGSAEYYAWDPPEAPGFRFIALDTLSEGGVVEQSANGNIDDPQFQWLKGQLNAATAADKLVVLFGHHPVRSLDSEAADEEAGPCVPPDDIHGDTPEHNHNPGCDIDPRNSEPVHVGADRFSGDPRESLTELLDQYPHVIAYVAGHTHENRVTPFPRTGGGAWWGIETSALADWPVQHRLLEVMDNNDGTLSIFGTILNAAAMSQAPAPGPASSFTTEQLAAINRTIAYNDPQGGGNSGASGAAKDQNVELLVTDPRASAPGYPRPKGASPMYASLAVAYKACTASNRVHAPPLSFPSCNPPQQASSFLTVGTPDANGQAAKSSGFVRAVVVGNPGGADDTDVRLTASVSDVRLKGSLAGYGGELRAQTVLRVTDKANGFGAASGYTEQGTVVDVPFGFALPCVGLANPTDGSNCSVDTSADAVMPGSAPEGKRSIWEMGQVEMYDGGPDGDADTFDNTLFMRQGVFVP